MELTGYEIIRCDEPDEETVRWVDFTFRYNDKYSEGPTTHCLGGPELESFLQDGVEKNLIENRIARGLDMEYRSIIKQRPVLCAWNRTESAPASNQEQHLETGLAMLAKTAHPSEEAISMIRVVRGSINPGRQLLLFPASDGQKLEEFRASPQEPVERILTPGSILLMRGPLKLVARPPSVVNPGEGVLFVWKGFSKRPMFRDIRSPNAYPFMKFREPINLEGRFPEEWMRRLPIDSQT